MIIPTQKLLWMSAPILLPLAPLGWAPGESLSLGAGLGLGSPNAVCRVSLKAAGIQGSLESLGILHEGSEHQKCPEIL